MKVCGIPGAPPEVRRALETLWAAGYEACPVGGCVRDTLLGGVPQDWDICTSARPEETMAAFAGRRVIPTGLRHGTVTLLLEGRPLEITTFRRESAYGDSRHPDRVEFVRGLEEDLSRRDFTVNAMAFASDGSVIDLFGGEEDLRAGIIRCVGAPEERFREDALRILRALRFASRLGFRLAPETATAVHAQRGLLARISRERCFSELKGILTGGDAGRILLEYGDVIFELIPELAAQKGFQQHSPYHIHELWVHTAMAVEAAPPEEILRLTMLLHDAAKPEKFFTDEAGIGHFYGHGEAGAAMADDILRRLRCDNDTRNTVTKLISLHDMAPPRTLKGTRRLLIRLGEADLRRLIACWRADSSDRASRVREENLAMIAVTESLLDELVSVENCFSLRDLAVNGRDLIDLGFTPGPALGETLRELFRLVTEEGLPNRREPLLEAAGTIRNEAGK